MNVIHDRFKVFCNTGECEYELQYPRFEESDMEIRIKTPFYNSDLHRGWIGDLTYKTGSGIDIKDCNLFHDIVAEETYKDVLLAKVNMINENGIDYEYVFLKK